MVDMSNTATFRFTAAAERMTVEDLTVLLRDGYNAEAAGTETDRDGNPHVWVEYRMHPEVAAAWYDRYTFLGMREVAS